MSLKERFAEDLKDALRRHDESRKTALRLLQAAIHNAEIAAGKPLSEADTQAIIQRQVRQRRESIDEFKKGSRPDLVAKEEAELAVLLSYLPLPLTLEELREAARQVIQQVGARGPSDKGKVIPVLIAELAGRAEGRDINAVVTELLGSSSGR